MENASGANRIEGNLTATGRRFGVVAARFNEFIVRSLVQGALDAVRRHGGDTGTTDVVWVPGAFEIPLAAKRMALSGRYDALICVGAVIRGSTPHFDYVAGNAASGVSAVALEAEVPVIFGVLTTDNIEQAVERAGTKAGNKGFEAAAAAMEMADLMVRLEDRPPEKPGGDSGHHLGGRPNSEVGRV